jgi:hypothetical protein
LVGNRQPFWNRFPVIKVNRRMPKEEKFVVDARLTLKNCSSKEREVYGSDVILDFYGSSDSMSKKIRE